MPLRGVSVGGVVASALFVVACGSPEQKGPEDRAVDAGDEDAAVDAGDEDAAVDAGGGDAAGIPPCVPEPTGPGADCSVSGYWSGTLSDYLSNGTYPLTLRLVETESGGPTGGVCSDVAFFVRGELNNGPASGGRSDDQLCLYVMGIGSDFVYRGTLSSDCSSVGGDFTAESYTGSWSATWQSLCPP